MAKQTINIGTSANDGTGDPLRTAFTKINQNFTELYGNSDEANDLLEDSSPQLGGDLDLNGRRIITGRSNENIRLSPSGTGTIELQANTNVTGNITATGDIVANGNINLGNAASDQVKVTGVFEADQLQIDGTTLTSTVTNGAVTIQGNGTGGVNIADITINDNEITASNSNSNLVLSAGGTGDILVGALKIHGTTVSSDTSTKLTFAEAVDVTGALVAETSLNIAGDGATVTGIKDEDNMASDSATKLATQQSIKAYADTKTVLTGSTNNTITTVTGANAIQGEANLTFDGSTLALTGAQTISSTLGVSGVLTTANVNTVGTHTVTGQSDIDYVRIKDNTISTNASNANLSITANGSGTVNFGSPVTFINQDVDITGSLTVDNININGNAITATNSNGGINITPHGTGTVTIAGNFVAVSNTLSAGDIETSGTVDTNTVRALTSNGNLKLATQGTGNVDVDNKKIINLAAPTAGTDATNKTYVDARVGSGLKIADDTSTVSTVAAGDTIKIAGGTGITTALSGGTLTITNDVASGGAITFVGDDSTGTAVLPGETFRIRGTGGATVAVSGDVMTITGGSDDPIKIVGDDSNGTNVTLGSTIKFAGATGIGTAMSGDTLTITGPTLTNYAQKTDVALKLVGDDSNGTSLVFGETFKIAGATNITTAVSGDVLTVTGTTTPIINAISSSDSSEILVNDGMRVSGPLTASTIDTNTISSSDSTVVTINDGLNVTGTIFADTITVSTISAPSDSTGTYTITSPTTITLDPVEEIINDAPMKLVSKTVAQLGSLTSSAGSMVFCTNESGGAIPAFYDGSNWRRVSDRAIVS